MLLFGVLAGWLCVSGWLRIVVVAVWMSLWMAAWAVMCEWWLAHCGRCGVFGWLRDFGSGCFLRLLWFGSVGWSVMCERLVAHCGGCGVDVALDGGLGCYV